MTATRYTQKLPEYLAIQFTGNNVHELATFFGADTWTLSGKCNSSDPLVMMHDEGMKRQIITIHTYEFLVQSPDGTFAVMGHQQFANGYTPVRTA